MSKVTAESDGRSQVGHTLEDVIVRRREGREKGRIAFARVSGQGGEPSLQNQGLEAGMS